MEEALPLFGGRFECVRRIGSGGAADVYEAKDLRFGTRCALKVLRGRVSGGGTMTERLRDEARVMGLLTRTLKHPNVLQVWDFGTDDGQDWVATELAEGGSLQDLLEREGPMPVERAIGYTIQILAALSAAHRLGVVHRDVKPHNVLLDANGVALLSDFGIAMLGARLFGDEPGDQRRTRAGVSMGSFAYMPPEQRLDARSVGPTADVYAAGATLYALLTAGNPVDLFAAEAHSSRWEGLPGPLLDVLLRATAKEPSARWPTAAAFGAALAAALEALPPGERGARVADAATGRPPAPTPPLPEAFQRATRQAVTFVQSEGQPADAGPSALTSEGGYMTSMPEAEGTHAAAEHRPGSRGVSARMGVPTPDEGPRVPTVVPDAAAPAGGGAAPGPSPIRAWPLGSAPPTGASESPEPPSPAGLAERPPAPGPPAEARPAWGRRVAIGVGVVAILLLAVRTAGWGPSAPTTTEDGPAAGVGRDPAAPSPPGAVVTSPGPVPAGSPGSAVPPGPAAPPGAAAPSAATAPVPTAAAPAGGAAAAASAATPRAASAMPAAASGTSPRDPAEVRGLPCSPGGSRSGPTGVWEGSNAGHDFTLWVCVSGGEATAVSRDVWVDGEPVTASLHGTWADGVLSLADDPSLPRPRTYTLGLGAAGLLTGSYEVGVTGARRTLSLARRRSGG